MQPVLGRLQTLLTKLPARPGLQFDIDGQNNSVAGSRRCVPVAAGCLMCCSASEDVDYLLHASYGLSCKRFAALPSIEAQPLASLCRAGLWSRRHGSTTARRARCAGESLPHVSGKFVGKLLGGNVECMPMGPSASQPVPAQCYIGHLHPGPLFAAPKYASVWEQAADIANTLLGTLGLSEAVTDNASVNVVPLQVRRWGGGRLPCMPLSSGRCQHLLLLLWMLALLRCSERWRVACGATQCAAPTPCGCRTAAQWP